MSYLSLKNGIPNFSKAVISFWFRVPKESVRAGAKTTLGEGDFKHMQSMLPLVTFGKPQQNKNYVANPPVNVANDVSGTHPGVENMSSTGFTSQIPYDVDPCLIGLYCRDDGTFDLAFNLQTGVEMVTSATTFVTTRVDYYDNTGPPPYTGPLGENGWEDNYTQHFIEDASYVDNDQLQWFYVQSSLPQDDPIAADEWHHVLLSFDISGTASIGQPYASSNCQLWYAIDDKDYRGPENMQPYRATLPQNDNLGPNIIVTNKAWQLSGSTPDGGFHYGFRSVPPPSGRYSGGDEAIPSEDEHFGFPAAPNYVDAIYRIELAEFQMWTGVTLDTGVEKNRRAFLDYERDENGNPIKDKDGKFTLIPVDPVGQPPTEDKPDGEPAPAEKLLGKKPEILLHGSSDWIDGKNTGTTGMDYSSDPPEIKPAGQFKPTGGINAYTPDPSLTKSGSSTRRKAGPVRLTKKPAANARL